MKPGNNVSGVRAKLIRRAVWLVCVVICWFPSPVRAQADAEPKRVLVLYWYNKDYSWNVNFDRSFQTALQSAPAGPFEYYPEYLETDRFPGEHQSHLLHEHLRQKYADRRIDVVVATSDASLNFLLKYRADLFPQAPIVFTATRPPTTEQLAAGPGMTGLNILTDHRRTVDLALRLHPHTRHIFIVSGTLEHDRRLETVAREQLQGYESRVDIEYLTDLPPEELIAKTKALPERSLVLYVWQQSRNEHGRVLETQEVLASVAPSVRVPIYGMTNLYIGLGAVGGYINLAETTGAKAGELATRVASGARPQDIPVENAPLVPIFDWRELRRWGISEDRLPPGSVVRFRELSFWDQYKWRIIGVISLCLVEALLIFALLAQRARRSRAEEGLRLSEEKFSKAFRASPDVLTIVRLSDGRILDINDLSETLLGYSRDEMIGRTTLELNQYANPEDRAKFFRLAEEQGFVRDFETDFRCKGGNLLRVSASAEQITINKDPCLIIIARDITERRRVEEEKRKLIHDLDERVKELTALHRAARILQQERADASGTLREIALLLPPAFQYPEITAGRVRLGEIEYTTPGFTDAQPVLHGAFTTTDGRPGSIEVVYTEERPPADEGPYLAEERALINTLADMLRTDYDRRRAEEELRLSQERYFKTFHASPVAVVLARLEDGLLIEVNEAAQRFFGFSREEMIGRTTVELGVWANPDDRRQRVEELERFGSVRDREYQFRTKQGEALIGLYSSELMEIDGVKCIQTAVQDITDRKRAEVALRESERRFSETLTNIEMIAVMVDMNGDITFCNDYLLRITGWQREEAIGRNWYEMFLPEDEKKKVMEILGEVEPTGDVALHMENEIKTRSGERRLVKWTNTTLRGPDAKVIGLAALGDDITERKEAEEQLKTSSRQLRALSESLRKAKEDEGIRIAREIHDELGSALTSLKWSLLRLDKVYSGNGNPDGQSGAQEEIAGMVGLVDTTINTVRRIASELRPGVLDDLGLIAAIEWHAQQFQEHTGIVCRFDSLIENVELNREQATAVFRIFQEAMTNILRHAQATKVNIIIEEEEGEFVLEIKDNGRGITEGERSGARSLGLLGMRERAHSLSGKVEINGFPEKGTVLIVRLPMTGGTAS